MHRVLLVGYLFIISSLHLFSMPEKESRTQSPAHEIMSSQINIDKHNSFKKNWRDSHITSYTMKVSYQVFSPARGIWIINVENGILTEWQINNRKNQESDKQTAQMFTQENLYDMAEHAYIKEKKDLYVTIVTYDPSGYIKEIVHKPNPEYTKNKPTDRGFRIRVLSIVY